MVALLLGVQLEAVKAVARPAPKPLVADEQQDFKINSLLKQFSEAPAGAAGKIVPEFLEQLKNIAPSSFKSVYGRFAPFLKDASVDDALVQALTTSDAEMASSILMASC